jgi:hypothetical protein
MIFLGYSAFETVNKLFVHDTKQSPKIAAAILFSSFSMDLFRIKLPVQLHHSRLFALPLKCVSDDRSKETFRINFINILSP